MKNYRNHEGYHDPTAGEAIKNINRKFRNRLNKPLAYKIGEVAKVQLVKGGVIKVTTLKDDENTK